MKQLIFSILSILFCYLGLAQEERPLPQFHGTYLVVNNHLTELNASMADSVRGIGHFGNAIIGIRNIKGVANKWINDENIYFIVYHQALRARPFLVELEYKDKVTVKNPLTGQEEVVTANMHVPKRTINLRTAPLEGRDGALILVPEFPLENGIYAFDLGGRMSSMDMFDATTEANAGNNIWSFVISRGSCLGMGELSQADLDKGEFTIPPGFGMWAIEGFQYAQIPAQRNSEIKSVDIEGDKYEALAGTPNAMFKLSELRSYFILFSEVNRKVSSNSTRHLNYVPYRDMEPENMFISKLQAVQVDMRSRREIKRNEPPQMETVWITEHDIKFDIEHTIEGRVSKIIPKEALSPGIYAFHNGGINGNKYTFRAGLLNYPVLYSFQVE